MASYDPYDDRGYSSRRAHVQERDRRDERDPRYLGSDYSRVYPSRELVARAREDSDLSVEEVRRDFPPPTGRDIRRARSAGHHDGAVYESQRGFSDHQDRDYDYRSRPQPRRSPSSTYYEEEREHKPKHKSMSKNEKIIAAVAGAVIAAGGKEIYDRREAKEGHTPVQRNPLSSVALAGVGALAAYQGAEFYSKQQAKKDQKTTYLLHRGRDGHVDEYYSSEDDAGPREKKGHKNFLESALAATGLGAAVKSFTGGHDDRSDDRSRGGSRSRSRSRGGGNKIQKAAMASLLAGATEAFRVSKEPGGWRGEKTKRILTAAAGAATVDAATGSEHGKLGLAESVIGGLIGNRLINGTRKDIEEDRSTGRSRSRSRARGDGGGGHGGLAALATAGLGAFAGKKILDHSRSRSRGRGDRSDDDYDDRSRSRDRDDRRRRGSRSRSRSVVDKARNSLAKLGIGAGAGAAAEDYRRRDQDDYDDRSDRGSRRSRRRGDDDYDDDDQVYDRDRGYDDDRSRRGNKGGGGGGGRQDDRSRDGARGGYSSGEDLGDSDEDRKRHKKMRDHRH